MTTGVLSPLQLIAGASLLQNQGLTSSAELLAAIDAYESTPVMSAFFQAVEAGGNIRGLSANTVSAFSDSIPTSFSALGNSMVNVITQQSSKDFGNGDISKFVQALNVCVAYTVNTNLFVNSAVNSQTYLANTFTTMNDTITGDITTINLATSAFGSDLEKLGYLIDLGNLGDLGTPLSLLQRIIERTGNIPVLSAYLLNEGVPEDVVVNLTDPNISVIDSVQKLMYMAMTKITGSDLNQILKLLKITTSGIDTMADLLNPFKLFPSSYLSLTVTTPAGTRAVYLNNSGAVNTKLINELPNYVIGLETNNQA